MEKTLFFTLLKSGAQPYFVAEAFATALNQQSNEDDELSWQVAANFIKECFAAMNFEVQISAEDAEDSLRHFMWPTDAMQHYVFVYDRKSFRMVEHFLSKLCEVIEVSEHPDSTITSTQCRPIYWFMQLIAVWIRTCQQLRNQNITKYFNEPIARIDFQLLCGFQNLRVVYRNDFPTLDTICNRLLESVLLGILYPETHVQMISALTKMLHHNFHLFCGYLNSTANFYETILTANLPKSFYKNIYKSLFRLLNTYCLNYELVTEGIDDQQRQNSLDVSNFLIKSKMLNIYYHYLTKESNKLVLMRLLDFLLLLQSKLPNLDCFLDTFMEAVLLNVLKSNDEVGDKSAKFYMAVSKRRADHGFICTQCVQVYFAHNTAPDGLLAYIKRLWKYFEIPENLDIFVSPINHSDKENEKYRIWGAHFLCAFLQYMLVDYATNRSKIMLLLQQIIEALRSMKCLITQTVIVDFFQKLIRIEIPNKETDLKEIFQLLENCAEYKFLSFEDWQYPLQKQWFLIFEKLSCYSENVDRFKETMLSFAINCADIIQNLDAHNEPLNATQAQKYSCVLQKLCIMTQTGYYKLKIDDEILSILERNLLTGENNFFLRYAGSFKMLIDVYAIELFVVGLIHVFEAPESRNNAWIVESVVKLENFLKVWLQNAEVLKEQPIVRIKTYFICLVGIYITFGSSPQNSILRLTTPTYELLVRTLLYILLKPTGRKSSFNEYVEYTEVHPLRSLSYGQSMINYFSQLHSAPYIEINDHYIWHICLYYALPRAANFQNVLHDLLLNLVHNRFSIYKRIIPIVIYNLFKQQPPLYEKTIVNAIKAHKSFIDNLNIEERSLLNCHVVLKVIENLNKSLSVRSIAGDRLAPLKHLSIFFQNLKLSSELEGLMQQEIANLRRNSLRVSERKTLSEFLVHFERPSAERVPIQSTPK